MPESAQDGLDELRRVAAGVDGLLPELERTGDAICATLQSGGRVYTFGNGGSAADAQHLAAELVGRFRRDRRPLPVVALSVDPSVVAGVANDYAYKDVFARQIEALAGPADIVLAFSTNGRSPNVVEGLAAARLAGATTVLFGGGRGGQALAHADHAILIPSESAARIQEMRVLFIHLLSERIDRWAAGDEPAARRSIGRPPTR